MSQKVQNYGSRVLRYKTDRIIGGVIARRGFLPGLGNGSLLVWGLIHVGLFGLCLLPLASAAHQLVDACRQTARAVGKEG